MRLCAIMTFRCEVKMKAGNRSTRLGLEETSQRNGLRGALAFSRGERAVVGHFGAGSAVLCNGMASATKL